MTLNQVKHNCQTLSSLGAELVFTQDALGNYHSFYWQWNIPELNFVNDSDDIKLFPQNKDTYFQSIERILTNKIPEQCHCILCYKNHCLTFKLIISPIILPNGEAKLVLVMGNLLKDEQISSTLSLLPVNPDRYQKLLINIARKIRRTLNLETIWQQTVDSIGEGLQVNRCLLLAPTNEDEYLEIKAEYCDPHYNSLLGYRFNFHNYEEIKEAILFRQPTYIDLDGKTASQALSVLLVPTFHQQEFNGIIALHQCDHNRQWNQAELELVQELADQVGTAIAHATIYQKLELANKEAEEASRLKSEFLASTSHELRTPLNGMLGFLRLVLDDMADDVEEEKQFIDQAYNSALHLLNLINDILDIAKIEAGKLEFQLETISLNQICDDIYKFAHSQGKKKNLYINIDLPATYDQILLYGDYQRILQIMLNLVSNSLKFTHEGGIDITAEIIPKQVTFQDITHSGMIKISVADTGIGVSLEKQDKLFETFYQVDGSRTKTYGGTGLGLTISKRLIEAMGGKISFYSMGEDLGSTVTITVPLAQLPVLKTEK
jgi:signal transduction histidine kinase